MAENEAIQKLNEQLLMTGVLDNMDVGIVVYDSNGDFVYVNTVMINWRNIPRQEYLTMNVHDFTDVLDVCVFDLVCRTKQRVSRLQYYRDFQKIDASPRMRIVTGTPIFDGDGNIKYVVAMLQDVDEFETRYHRLLDEHQILREDFTTGRATAASPTMIAKSPNLKNLLSITESVASLDSTILLYGESGCGKEVFARYIHSHSCRKAAPLITVNCAALPENLIEAELFGYAKGSFTGANREGKVGLAEAADGGTLFLDEINSLPFSIQGKVLRMIEEKSIQRVGSTSMKKVDFRLIAATNRDLLEMVRAGTFREDLYYRLNVVPLTIPPLRERREDIIPLCLHFLHDYCQKYNVHKSFSDSVLERIRQYAWPGNVRELRNFVERMVVMTPASTTVISSVSENLLRGDNNEAPNFHHTPEQPHSALNASKRNKLTKEYIQAALRLNNGRRKETAAYLGISLRQLQYKIKEHGLSSRCSYD